MTGIGLGVSDFKALRMRDNYFIDKSLYIKHMIDNPYVSVIELSKAVGISVNSIMCNIDYMRGKYLRRVGADKNDFWEIIE